MTDWVSLQGDYVAFVLLSLALFAGLELWLRRRRAKGRLSRSVWPGLAGLLIAGWFFVDQAGDVEKKRIRGFMEGVAPTYAQELTRMGHERISLATAPDDPSYLAMIEAQKRWLSVNPAISDMYTYRLVDGRVRLIVDSETDYDRNGVYDGQREERLPIGREYAQADEAMRRALEGVVTFSDELVRDAWGVWVSAQVPMRNAQGRVEAALGVDYPAEQWLAAIALGRERMLFFLTIPLLILAFAAATSGALRAEIGARLAVEGQLRESEARLRAVIDNMPFDFWAMDAKGRYTLVNEPARKRWGREALALTLADLDLPEETYLQWAMENRRAFAGEVISGEVDYVIRGERRHFYRLIAPIRNDAAIVGILGLNLDFTDRVRAQEAQRRSERKLALHVHQTPLAVVEWDLDTRIVGWNPAAERIFGYTKEEVLGRPGLDFIVPPDVREQVAEVWGALVNHQGGTRSTNHNTTKDGRTILCEWYNTPLVDENGTVVGIASHCQDITERDAMEKQFRQAQKLESIGQLAGGVAHEFNNLLTPMLIQLELIRIERADDAELLAKLRLIEQAIQQAAQLNQRILAVGRRSPEKREPLALNVLVEDAVGLLRHTLDRRITLVVDLAPALAPLLLDRSQVTQILVNLAVNARDSLLEKVERSHPPDWTPRIELRTEQVEAAERTRSGTSVPFSQACQRLSVIDNGLGIPHAARQRIFEPFYTTKAPGRGTGLGLAMVWNVVHGLGGWIELEGEPGQGAVFHVYFPVPEIPPALVGVRPVATPELPKAQRPRRILLVEDNALVADTLTRLLTGAGHDVVATQHGGEAWEMLESRTQTFDLVLADYNMPVMNGAELLRRVRGASPDLPFYIVSGHLTGERLQELERLGVTGVLDKPFQHAKLFALLT